MQEGNMINIYYDLSGPDEYEVKVYCSQDAGNTWGDPLINVNGAVGKDIRAGNGKKITWDVMAERGGIEGNIAFKVEAAITQLSETTGSGISFSLGGRGSLMLHKPSYDSKEQGKVVVAIKVDKQGRVTSAVPGAKGTNVSDQTLWQLAKDAALLSRFVADPDAPEMQVGFITYNFIRQN